MTPTDERELSPIVDLCPPVVSVIVPIYKGERFVAKAIRSLLDQTLRQIEIIVINDGSPDASGDIISPLLVDPRIKYIEQKNAGVAAARNTALRASTGKYIGLCDQDDEWLPHKAEAQCNFLDEHPEVAMVHSDVDYIDADGKLLPHDEHFPAAVCGNCFARIFMGNPIMTVSAMFRRSIIDEVGQFDPSIKYSDDYDLWLRITANHKIGFIPLPLARYRLHDSNNSNNQVAIRSFTLKVLKKAEREHPEACSSIAAVDKQRRYASLYRRMADYSFGDSRRAAALKYMCLAAFHEPSNAHQVLIPSTWRNRAAWYWTRFKRAIS